MTQYQIIERTHAHVFLWQTTCRDPDEAFEQYLRIASRSEWGTVMVVELTGLAEVDWDIVVEAVRLLEREHAHKEEVVYH